MKQSTLLVPGHLAIIMDGNGRWAERRGRPRWMGHVVGARTVRTVVAHCARAGVEQLTLYAFSSDNWKRPGEEVAALLDLFESHFRSQGAKLAEQGIRLSVIGRRDRLPLPLRRAISEAERRTAAGRTMHLRVALDYSSRAAIQGALPAAAALRGERPGAPVVDARGEARHEGRGDARGELNVATILPPVDLLLRTGGERRLSDFLLWECAYAELAFLDVLWPDVTGAVLDAVFADFASRERRFGTVAQRASA